MALFVVLFVCAVGGFVSSASGARAETRTLKLYYLHTGEKAQITFKKNGKYIKSGLDKANRFLRDWRRNEPTKMDPKLLDLIWEVYQKSGSRQYINVISGYRSLKTNNMLRRRGRGVASKSQHTLGKAMDFFLPDVKLSKLRAIGLKMGVGGVGYYPRSGSPFVHMDTGRVRHWPRMTRKQLVRVFPNGKTLHVPTDGKPLKGYNLALAEYKRSGRTSTPLVKDDNSEKAKNFFRKLLGADKDDEADDAGEQAPAPKPVKPQVVKPAKPTAPVPSAPVGGEEPNTAAPKTVLAAASRNAAPATVPVPTPAPRGGNLRGGTQMALLEPETPVEEQKEEEKQFELASVPVPQRRPAQAAAPQQELVAALRDGQDGDADGTQLAYANAKVGGTSADASGKARRQQLASLKTGSNFLSADEIFLMRRRARQSLDGDAPKAVAANEPVKAVQKPAVSGSEPVRPKPGKNAPPIKMAKLKAKGIIERPVSLDKTETSDTSTLGKWALSGNATLGNITDMRPPAYGKGALRNLSVTNLRGGFVSTDKFLSR